MSRISRAFIALLAGACSGAQPVSVLETAYDKDTGRLREISISKAKDGKPNIFSYMDGRKFVRIEIDQNEDGKIDRWEYYTADQKLEKVGFSRANDGVVDAWAFRAPDGTVGRVEVSTRRDGRVDKWETYQDGRLINVAFDTNGDGEPNHVIDYRKDQPPR